MSRLYNTSLFLRIWMVTLGTFGVPVAFLYGLFSFELVLAIFIAYLVSWPVFFLVHISGNSVVNRMFGLGDKPTRRQQTVADCQRARHLMSNDELEEALSVVDDVLERMPAFSDALFLRAQILQRQGKADQARTTVEHILKNCRYDPIHRRWASTMLKELSQPQDTKSPPSSG